MKYTDDRSENKLKDFRLLSQIYIFPSRLSPKSKEREIIRNRKRFQARPPPPGLSASFLSRRLSARYLYGDLGE